jgi:hypothetical protein
MAATQIARSTIVDDDGSGSVGTVWDAASLGTIVYDKVDGVLSTNVVFGGTIDSESSAEDSIQTAGGVRERGRAASMGVWTAIDYAATNLATSTDGSTWGSSAADQVVYAYAVIGKTLLLDFNLQNTSVGSGDPIQLRLDLPSGFTVSRTTITAGWCSISGAKEPTWIQAATGADYLDIYRSTQGAWTASTDNTSVYGLAIVSIA